jgi:amino acid transporter
MLALAATGHALLPGVVWAILVIGISTLLACRDVQFSTRLMLWIEIAAVLSILAVLVLVLARHGLHLDRAQTHLQNVTPGGVRLALVLALFSFVGFESASTLGHEVRNPLKTIPRAVMQSALLGGAFFLLATYTETLGFNTAGLSLGASDAPFHVLSLQAHVPALGLLIDVAVFISLFACTLACISAAARVMLLMAHNGIANKWLLRGTHTAQHAPVDAALVSGVLILLPVCGLVLCGVNGFDIYGWMGSMAVYGFLTAYALACIALPIFLLRRRELTPWMMLLPAAAVMAILLALVGTLYPVPPPPYSRLPYVYLAVLLAGLLSSWMTNRAIAAKR